jgi:hypothetical protein
MGRYSYPVGPGDVRDISFRRHPQRFEGGGGMWWVVLDEERLGTVAHLRGAGYGWAACSYKDYDKMTEEQWNSVAKHGVEKPEEFRIPDPLRKVDGFRTRLDAGLYVIRHWYPGMEDYG